MNLKLRKRNGDVCTEYGWFNEKQELEKWNSIFRAENDLFDYLHSDLLVDFYPRPPRWLPLHTFHVDPKEKGKKNARKNNKSNAS